MNSTFLYVVVVLIWGSTWLAIEFQLGIVEPEVSVMYRYVLASALLFTWSGARRLRLRFDSGAHVRFIFLGLFLFSLNYIAAYHAQRYVTSALIAIVFSMMLGMNIVNARLIFGVRAGRSVWFGATLGMCGIALMFWPAIGEMSFADETLIGALLGFAGTYLASLGNMVSQSAQRRGLPILQTNAWGMFYGAVFTGIVVVLKGQALVFETTVSYVLSLAYLALFGSVIAFGAYLTLLGRIGAHKVGYATVMFPVVALSLSMAFEGLTLDIRMIAGIAIALAGNYFVMKRDSAEARTS